MCQPFLGESSAAASVYMSGSPLNVGVESLTPAATPLDDEENDDALSAREDSESVDCDEATRAFLASVGVDAEKRLSEEVRSKTAFIVETRKTAQLWVVFNAEEKLNSLRSSYQRTASEIKKDKAGVASKKSDLGKLLQDISGIQLPASSLRCLFISGVVIVCIQICIAIPGA